MLIPVSFEFLALKLMKSLVENEEFKQKIIHSSWKNVLSLLKNYKIQMEILIKKKYYQQITVIFIDRI